MMMETLPEMLRSLLQGESDLVANLANASALLYQYIPRLNWCGFYRLDNDELVLYPFQGKVACVRLKVGRGVCGTAVAKNEYVLVNDVHLFDGHVACDPNSRSELVIPLHRKDGSVFGVLDLDSEEKGRFPEVLDVLLKCAKEIEKIL